MDPKQASPKRARKLRHYMSFTSSMRSKKNAKAQMHDKAESTATLAAAAAAPPTPGRASRLLPRPTNLPAWPDVSALSVSSDPSTEYAVLVSMYEVYNDKIFDLLVAPAKPPTKEPRRRPLLFKATEMSSERKVVAGLRKVVCTSFDEAVLVLEAGLHERRVTGTGSNSASSRSHGFFCVEVRKRARGHKRAIAPTAWSSSTLTVVDLAGSERARDAKTQGATLAEAGKINESLMYLGQCLQMQSDMAAAAASAAAASSSSSLSATKVSGQSGCVVLF
jgi:hypothetical protein